MEKTMKRHFTSSAFLCFVLPSPEAARRGIVKVRIMIRSRVAA